MGVYYEGICAKCGKEEGKIDVHHKDRDHNNNVLENLIYLCHKCHVGWHKKKWKYEDFGLEDVHLKRYPLKRGIYKIKKVSERRKMLVCNDWYTVSEIAEELRMPPHKVTRLCREGKLGFSKPGKSYLIPRESLDEYLKIIR